MPVSKKPKLETVARRAGVSLSTASQALRGAGRISERTRERVLKAAGELHYVPDSRAADMRSGQNREIGFVINRISNPFNAEVISGVSDLLEAEGYLVSILDARDDPRRQQRHLESFIRNGRGGLLWVPADETPSELPSLLQAHGTPTVTFLRRSTAGAFDHVGIRNAEATQIATDHLAQLGHRHIAYLGGTGSNQVRRDRISGHAAALEGHGLGQPLVWPCEDGRMAGRDAMAQLLDARPETTAVMCNGDMVALGACLALAQAGLVPGRDVSVVGFDGIREAAMAAPALTTMEVSPYELGQGLARVLLERIRSPSRPTAVTEVSAKLVIRDSTGPIPG